MIQRINPIYLMRRPGHKQAQRVGTGTFVRGRGGYQNIWRDNPDVIQSGWTDNGDGSYTRTGAGSTYINQNVTTGELIAYNTYYVFFTVTAYTSGVIRVVLVSNEIRGQTLNASFPGDTEELVTLDTFLAGPSYQIALNGLEGFTGTVSNIQVRHI